MQNANSKVQKRSYLLFEIKQEYKGHVKKKYTPRSLKTSPEPQFCNSLKINRLIFTLLIRFFGISQLMIWLMPNDRMAYAKRLSGITGISIVCFFPFADSLCLLSVAEIGINKNPSYFLYVKVILYLCSQICQNQEYIKAY